MFDDGMGLDLSLCNSQKEKIKRKKKVVI